MCGMFKGYGENGMEKQTSCKNEGTERCYKTLESQYKVKSGQGSVSLADRQNKKTKNKKQKQKQKKRGRKVSVRKEAGWA